MSRKEYSVIDETPIVDFLFFPQKRYLPGPNNSEDFTFTVEEGIDINCRLYYVDYKSPWVLYFHGNGEVVSDYNYIAPLYNQIGINLLVADYRGYGKSSGNPSLTALLDDSHVIFKKSREEMSKRGAPDLPYIMGRSLGSIAAIELASNYPEDVNGLIIESGFLSPSRLLGHLGLPTFGLDFSSLEEVSHEKVRKISIPSLIIHGENDSLVPLQEGKDIYKYLGSDVKDLVIISGAEHNDIMFVDQNKYFDAIKKFVDATYFNKQGD